MTEALLNVPSAAARPFPGRDPSKKPFSDENDFSVSKASLRGGLKDPFWNRCILVKRSRGSIP